jgi:hypothetical protein
MLWRFQPQSEPFLYCFTSLHVYLYTFLGQGFILLSPFALGLFCTVQRHICICMDGSFGKTVFCYLRF